MKIINTLKISLIALLLAATSCKDLNTINTNNPDLEAVLATGADLFAVLNGGYVAWWEGVHNPHLVMALSIAADGYSMPWDDFGSRRMGDEPRKAYNNRISEGGDYKKIVEVPWYNCLSAVSNANDVLIAMGNGVSIDDGGPQDESVKAAAHLLRGLSWGYLGLIFDQALMVDESTDLEKELSFSTYEEMITAALAELEEAISIAESVGPGFIHTFFNGIVLDSGQFVQLCHSYAARFLSQWPRTAEESVQVDWTKVLNHAENGLTFNFGPEADGKFWISYHQYAFAETGQGPFWARIDQRLVAAFDSSQPARYPEVNAQGEPPLDNKMANSNDARLAADFLFFDHAGFPVERGEWFFSHYQHNRNVSDPGFAGDGASAGPMPTFLAEDNRLLKAEALLELGRGLEALAVLNEGARVNRGQLPALGVNATPAEVRQAIFYERAIELLSTSPMGIWFDRRRSAPRVDFQALDALGGLQIGTPAHLPVPEKELRIHNMPPYNFGGERDPFGVERVY